MKRIYLVRHGQTDSNKEMRYQGKINNPLNAVGMKQAEGLTELFANITIDQIYASPLTRAMQTATPLATKKNLTIKTVDNFKEISFGNWEGLTYKEIHDKWPENIDNFFKTPKSTRVIGGESFQDVADRAFPELEKIVKEQQDDTAIVVVTHGGVVRALECAAVGLDLNKVWKMQVDNCSVTTLEYKDNHYSLINYNETSKIE